MDYFSLVREIQDFPIKGVLFRDLSPVLHSKDAFSAMIKDLAHICKNIEVDTIAGIEARGFVFGAAIANQLNVGFVPIRKAGKLPPETEKISYSLEYGTADLEVSKGMLMKGERVVIVDDVIATGGTVVATIELLRRMDVEVTGVVAAVDLIELGGSKKITSETGVKVFSLKEY